MKLVVGSESTWSIRAWICARLADISFEEVVIPLGNAGYREQLARYSDTLLVPVLMDKHLHVHDSLAIAETLNEQSGGKLYPSDPNERAQARSLCAELHAGFLQLRSGCPFSLNPVKTVQSIASLQAELERLGQIFSNARLPFMFDLPGAVDAFYAVLAYRLAAYGIKLEGEAGEYQQALIEWPLFQQALAAATTWGRYGVESSPT